MSLPDDIKVYNRQLIDAFRAVRHPPGARLLLLLTTTGARGGWPHTTPLMFAPYGDRLQEIASNAGAARNPD